MDGFSITESKILNVLIDGRPHIPEEIMDHFGDGLAERRTLAVHICNIRKRLEPRGETIVCVTKGRLRPIAYQWVRLLPSACDGRT